MMYERTNMFEHTNNNYSNIRTSSHVRTYMGMTGFDERTKVSVVCMSSWSQARKSLRQHTSANLFSNMKNAIARAFAVPSFASALA